MTLILCMKVYDMERRQAAAQEREARKAARVALKERQERERNTKLKMEEEAYEMQLQVTICILYAAAAAAGQRQRGSNQAKRDLVFACVHLALADSNRTCCL